MTARGGQRGWALAAVLAAGAAAAQEDPRNVVATVNELGKVKLQWSLPPPSAGNTGLLLIRSPDAPPTGNPSNAVACQGPNGCPPGLSLGNGRIMAMLPPTATSYEDSDPVNGPLPGSVYYYRMWGWKRGGGSSKYSEGFTPTPNGVMVRTLGGAQDPAWCYSVGMSTTTRPVVEPGGRVLEIGNLGAITGNDAAGGTELWRPIELPSYRTVNGSIVQARVPLLPLFGETDRHLIAADQGGTVHVYNANTQALKWATSLPFNLSASPTVILKQFANAAFVAPADLIFVASRKSPPDLTNEVRALRSSDGSTAWTYSPGNLPMVTGEMLVDYANNRLWVGSTGAVDSLQIVDVNAAGLQTQPVATLGGLGPIDHGIVLGAFNTAIVATRSQGVFAFNLTTMQQVFHVPTTSAQGAPLRATSYVLPLADGFVVPLEDGSVRRYVWTGGATAPYLYGTAQLSGIPTGVRANFVHGKFIVATNAGYLHELEPNLAQPKPAFFLGTAALSTPSEDQTLGRAVVGTQDGRVCSVPFPFP